MKNIFLLLLGIMLFNCEPSGKKPAGMKIQELLKSREIKKISDIDILEFGKIKGRELATLIQKKLTEKLKSALQYKGIAHAIEFCNANELFTMDSLTKVYGAEIKRVSLKIRNKKNSPDSIEQQILEAYAYNMEKEIPVSEFVQIMEDGFNVLYTKPILLNNPLCLNCHGTVGNQISNSNYALIKRLYPRDSAINYNLNELRGMWSIKLSKKEIIKAMD